MSMLLPTKQNRRVCYFDDITLSNLIPVLFCGKKPMKTDPEEYKGGVTFQL
jgi:hypothetical protein